MRILECCGKTHENQYKPFPNRASVANSPTRWSNGNVVCRGASVRSGAPASLLASIKVRLGLDHIHGGSRYHERPIDAVQRPGQAAAPGHIARDDFDGGNIFDPLCLCSVSNQDPSRNPVFHEFVRYERTGRPGRFCEKYHCNLLDFGWSLPDHLVPKTGGAAETHRSQRIRTSTPLSSMSEGAQCF